ncbi:tRNA pseudouridine(13) synthase TruD [bacterium 3DAC]|nr:tRNA pseudouridine(13) synthase TruD [Dictyoglomota bacterium]UZN22725.1 tRNA pseudouridine(13) synthase TruD [bacterium 3DAC]
MWIVKSRPEDFIVVEDINLPSDGAGYHLYFLKKSGRTTLAVVKELYRRYEMKKGDIHFAGMKDRDGVTYQYISSVKDMGRHVKATTYEMWHIKDVTSHVDRKSLRGNYFSLLIRGAISIDTAVLSSGFVNYFDYQRFAVFSEGMAARLILKRQYKEALWTLLTPGTRSLIKEPFDVEDFRECRKLSRTPWERRLFDFLRRKGPKYKEALRYVDGDQRAISMLAYQSYLWNKTVSKLIEHYGEDIRYIDVAGQQLAVARNVRVSYKVPFITWFLAEEWWDLPEDVRQAIKEVLEEEGFAELFELKTKVHGYTLVLRYRNMIEQPNIIANVASKDGVKLVFFLPTGSYATMYVKQLAVYHDEMVQVGDGEQGAQ